LDFGFSRDGELTVTGAKSLMDGATFEEAGSRWNIRLRLDLA
jgi:hypothetical protein